MVVCVDRGTGNKKFEPAKEVIIIIVIDGIFTDDDQQEEKRVSVSVGAWWIFLYFVSLNTPLMMTNDMLFGLSE